MHTMKQSRIVVAGTLAAACRAFGGSSATVAAAEKSHTLRATGGTRNVVCSNAEPLVRAREVNLGHTILNQDGCRCTVERKTDYSGITREDWTCEISLRTAPGHRKPNWNAGVSMRDSWNEPRGRTGGLCRRRTTPCMEPIASEDGATSARGAGNGSSKGETGCRANDGG